MSLLPSMEPTSETANDAQPSKEVVAALSMPPTFCVSVSPATYYPVDDNNSDVACRDDSALC